MEGERRRPKTCSLTYLEFGTSSSTPSTIEDESGRFVYAFVSWGRRVPRTIREKMAGPKLRYSLRSRVRMEQGRPAPSLSLSPLRMRLRHGTMWVNEG